MIARLSVRDAAACAPGTARGRVRRHVDRPVGLVGRGAGRPVRAASSNADEFLDQLADEDTTGLAREELEAALADEGSLWDPLPMTLPTYVNKARARRTVRTIELTGINSSGHDETDTALAREAAESRRVDVGDRGGQRKAAGA